jgi:hypothetical protein
VPEKVSVSKTGSTVDSAWLPATVPISMPPKAAAVQPTLPAEPLSVGP